MGVKHNTDLVKQVVQTAWFSNAKSSPEIKRANLFTKVISYHALALIAAALSILNAALVVQF